MIFYFLVCLKFYLHKLFGSAGVGLASNLYFSVGVAIIFIAVSLLIPNEIMGLYSKDSGTIHQSVIYLKIMTIGFIPQTITLMLSALLRNMECAKCATVAGGIAVVTNTILNYFFIFGIGIFPTMGIAGAALATCIARIIESAIIFGMFLKVKEEKKY